MLLRDALLAELDQEMASTRRVLERVPAAALAWKPHAKSFSLGALAAHLAELPHWGCRILDRDAYDLLDAKPMGDAPAPELDVAGILDRFDAHVSAVRASLVGKADGELTATWTLRRGGAAVLAMPRVSALERFLVHHVIHHRGQLTVYLRLQDVPLPPIYGPTADERM